jgi:MFS family permease
VSAARLLSAAALARTADAGAGVVIVLASVGRFGGPAQGSLVLAVLLVPHIVAGPFVGVVTDRARRPGLVHACFVGVFGTALGGVLALLGHVPQPAVLALAFVAGCCGSMVFGGLSSRLDDVVAAEHLQRVRGLDAATYNVADIFGPAAGAALVVSFGVPLAAGALTVSCLCAAVLLLTVRPVAATAGRPGAGVRARGRLVDDLRAGVRVMVVSRPLRAVTAATCVAMFGQGMMPSVAVLLGVAHGRPAGGGLLIAAIGVGALSGSLLMARRPVAVAPHRLALVCLVAMGAVLGVAAFVHDWVVLVALFAVAGLFDGPLLTSVLQVRSNEAPARARTQVFTLGAGFKLTAAAVGAASFAVVTGWPLWVLVVGVGGTQVVAAAVGAVLLTGRRALPHQLSGEGT